MRFDYYAATVPAQISHCIKKLSESHGDQFSEAKPVAPYKKAVQHDFTGLRLYSGGQNPFPHLVISGDRSPFAANFIRKTYPTHKVSRADVCIDFIEAGGFDRVKLILNAIAADIRPKPIVPMLFGPETDHADVGRSIYYGSPKSDVRIVIYEKGKQMRAQGHVVSADWFRIELRVRPRKARKDAAAVLTEADLWGFSKWSLSASKAVLNVCPEYHPDQSLRQSTAEQAVRHMLKQYRRAMMRYSDEIGEAQFFRQIKEALADAD